ncbi:MAG: dTDP-4-dehydrorhamnose reductase [Lentisphaerae bacterium GWF2_50_93]|nr:MAG: dTDP-4-dehydrorhamnose reductase [Lentisphaerae bacterium GWF2_50_93]
MSVISILGGRGMLGSDLAELAGSAGHEVLIFDMPAFDITKAADVQEAISKADIIVNCAAYTAVDKAETEREACRSVNALAAGSLAKSAGELGKYLIHISTDFVFGDDSDRKLSEEDKPDPLGWYGATKLEGEQLVASSGCRHAIVRIEWTYGRNGVNFISKLLDAAGKSSKLKVVGDQHGSPTWTADVAMALLCLIGKRAEGLYHFSAEGCASRYEVAKFILSEKRISKELSSCASSDFPAPAKRPMNSRFDCSKIDRILNFKRPGWQESMAKYLK